MFETALKPRAEEQASPALAWRKAAGAVLRVELPLLALITPPLLLAQPAFLPLLALLPLLLCARRLAAGHYIPATPLDWPIVGLLVGVLVSLFATPSIGVSVSKVSGLLLGIAMFYALVSWATAPERVRRALVVYLLAGLLLSLVALLGTSWPPYKLGLLDAVGQALPALLRGLPGAERGFQPNEVGGTLLLFLPLALVLVVRQWRKRGPLLWRLGGAIGVAAMLLLLLLTQSRSAIGGFFAGGCLLLWFAAPRLRGLFAVAASATLICVLVSGPQQLAARLFAVPPPDFTTTADLLTLKGRAEIWSAALRLIVENPLTGIGMNTFRYLAPPLIPFPAPDGDFAHAHNAFLQTYLDLGLPGLTGYVALWVLAALMLWRLWKSGWQRTRVAGLAAGLAAYFVFGLVDTVALGARAGLSFWAALALVVILWRNAPAEARVGRS